MAVALICARSTDDTLDESAGGVSMKEPSEEATVGAAAARRLVELEELSLGFSGRQTWAMRAGGQSVGVGGQSW